MAIQIQKGWKWCNRCYALFYADQPNVCPAGGAHNSTGSGYYLAVTAATAGAQEGWRWCKRCGAMAYGALNAGQCAAGGGHDFSGSGPYFVLATQPSGISQSNWRWCNKCQVLFYGGGGGGVCKAGGAHAGDASGNYYVGAQTVGTGIAIPHQAMYNSGELWLTLFQNGGFTDLKIPGGCSETPTAVQFYNKLYVFYQGQGDSTDLWFTTYDGVSFSDTMQASNIRLVGSPYALFHDNGTSKHIVIKLRGTSGSHDVWTISYDLNRWFSLNEGFGSACDPSGISVQLKNGKVVWTFFEDTGSAGTLKVQNQDGQYTVMQCTSSCRPVPIMYKDKMHLFHQGANLNGSLYYKTIAVNDQGAPGFSDDSKLNCSMSASPAPAVLGDKLYVFHEGYANNGELWYLSYDGQNWSADQRVPGIGVSKGCGACTFNFAP